jgi:hypothetical protein
MPFRRRSQPAPPTNASAAPVEVRPAPPGGARNVVVVVLDSLRYDSAMAAGMHNAARLGEIERRWSYASWTAPSHFNLLMGLLPHASPPRVYASEYYKADFARYSERFGVPGVDFASMLPSIWLPTYMRNVLGYRTAALVSMPVLNPATTVNRDFDEYTLMESHNDMAGIVERLHFDADRPTFWMLNIGETHYPYAVPGDDTSDLPRLSGVHGVLKHEDAAPAFFESDAMDKLRARQVRAATYTDGVLGALYDVVPPRTWIIVTSDHGELFGEGGYFGHGPIAHDKVLEVPFVEGVIR